jgi:hypothetical protein
VRYALKTRANSPCYFVCFRDAEGRRRELTTGEHAKHAAQDVAPEKIREDFAAKKQDRLPWGEAVELMLRHMQAQNLRPGTILQYKVAVNALRKVFPDSCGPADITPAMAERFKLERMEAKGDGEKRKVSKIKPVTVGGNLNNLSIVFGHWFRDTLKIIDDNPFAAVQLPKYDKAPPRIIAAEEQVGIVDWLQARWGWRLPLLFLETKAAIGCRISELAHARTEGLKDGRITFTSETTKGRKQRACLLPTALYAELREIAGPQYVFERFAEELRAIHRGRGMPHHARTVHDYTPPRLVNWLQDQSRLYFEETKAKRFKLHNFRGTAMSKARMAGVAESDAAVAFGCNPSTMRNHYLTLDEATIADKVFSAMDGI